MICDLPYFAALSLTINPIFRFFGKLTYSAIGKLGAPGADQGGPRHAEAPPVARPGEKGKGEKPEVSP